MFRRLEPPFHLFIGRPSTVARSVSGLYRRFKNRTHTSGMQTAAVAYDHKGQSSAQTNALPRRSVPQRIPPRSQSGRPCQQSSQEIGAPSDQGESDPIRSRLGLCPHPLTHGTGDSSSLKRQTAAQFLRGKGRLFADRRLNLRPHHHDGIFVYLTRLKPFKGTRLAQHGHADVAANIEHRVHDGQV